MHIFGQDIVKDKIYMDAKDEEKRSYIYEQIGYAIERGAIGQADAETMTWKEMVEFVENTPDIDPY